MRNKDIESIHQSIYAPQYIRITKGVKAIPAAKQEKQEKKRIFGREIIWSRQKIDSVISFY